MRLYLPGNIVIDVLQPREFALAPGEADNRQKAVHFSRIICLLRNLCELFIGQELIIRILIWVLRAKRAGNDAANTGTLEHVVCHRRDVKLFLIATVDVLHQKSADNMEVSGRRRNIFEVNLQRLFIRFLA